MHRPSMRRISTYRWKNGTTEIKYFQKEKIRGVLSRRKEKVEGTSQSSAMILVEGTGARDLERRSKCAKMSGTCRGYK